MPFRHQSEFRRCMAEMDTATAMKLWAESMPHLPQPKDRAECEVMLHVARTQSQSMNMRHRAYSHRWLTERYLPSMLPDNLRAKAERLYPRVETAVGVSVLSKFPEVKKAITGVMSDAVADAYAEGRTEPEFVRAQMMTARAKERKALGLD